MTPANSSGVTFVLIGLVVCTVAGWQLWRQRIRRRESLLVTVATAERALSERDFTLETRDPTPPGVVSIRQIRLALSARPVEVNLGDELRVWLEHEAEPHFVLPSGVTVTSGDRSTTAHLYRQELTALYLGLGGFALVCVVTGAMGLLRSVPPGFADSASSTIVLTGFAVVAGMTGVFGMRLAVHLLRAVPGSVRVRGRVIDVRMIPTLWKTAYHPLVEYTLHGLPRRVWGSPRWFAPTPGRQARVRVSGRSPHEAVYNTPFALFGLLCLLGTGAYGWILIADTLLLMFG